jgi:hypothetical protein
VQETKRKKKKKITTSVEKNAWLKTEQTSSPIAFFFGVRYTSQTQLLVISHVPNLPPVREVKCATQQINPAPHCHPVNTLGDAESGM